MRNTDLQDRAFSYQNVISTVIIFVCFIIYSFMLHVHVASMYGGKVHSFLPQNLECLDIICVFSIKLTYGAVFCSADQEVLCF